MTQTGHSKTTDVTEGDVNLTDSRSIWVTENVDRETREWLERDARVFLHQSLSTPCLNVLASCRNSSLEDLQGRRFLDFHGNSVHQVGFGNPRVVEAVKEQLASLSFCPRRYTNRPAVMLAERLAQLAPGNLAKVLFAPGGATAVGMALKLARVATGRFKTVSMWDSFHGASLDAISVGGEALFRSGIGPLLPGAGHVPPAEPYRCLWDCEGRCESCGLKCARYIDYVMEREGDVAAVIAEPVRCTAVHLPPPGYWQAVRAACDRHGALLIFDETAVCLGRTGRMFACEHFGVIPDILVLGKGLGGGIMPLAAIVAREELDVAGDKALGHYTHEKNPVACAAGLAALDLLEAEGAVERAAHLGERCLEALTDRLEALRLVGDVRGIGLLLAVELVLDRATKERAVQAAERVMYGCLSRGLSFKVSHGNCLVLTPPLTISRRDLERALRILLQVLLEVAQEGRPSTFPVDRAGHQEEKRCE